MSVRRLVHLGLPVLLASSVLGQQQGKSELQALLDRDRIFAACQVEASVTYIPKPLPTLPKGKSVVNAGGFSASSLVRASTDLNGMWTVESWPAGVPKQRFVTSNRPDQPEIRGSQVVFSLTPKSVLSSNPMLPVGPSPYLGLGASRVMHPQVDRKNGQVIITGSTKEWDHAVLTYSAKDLRPLTAVFTSHNIECRYRYSGWTGGLLGRPLRTIEEQSPHGAARIVMDIKSLTPGEPPRPVQIQWLFPGASIVDNRLGEPVTYSYKQLLALNGGADGLTSSRLLEITKERIDRRQGAFPPVPQKGRPQQQRGEGAFDQRSLIGMAAGAAILAGVAWFFFKSPGAR